MISSFVLLQTCDAISVPQAFMFMRKSARPSPPDLETLLTSWTAGRCIYHCDIDQDNFLIDSEGRVCIIDFQHVGVLSEAFQQYAFFNIDKAFAAKVGRKLGYQPYEAVNEMVKVSSLLHQRGG